jgi:N-acetylglucosaminyldiphosphoundecaprenol N-acetyl-beta-D-mannosaminyltransferase
MRGMNPETPTPHRYLLIQLADIGDLILTTPALAALRAAQPEAHLTLLTSANTVQVLEDGLVDEVITFDRRKFNSSLALLKPANLRRIFALREGSYDTVIIFHHFTLRLGTLKFALIAKVTGAQRVIGLYNGRRAWFLTERVPDEGFGALHQAQYWLALVAQAGADATPVRARVGFASGILPLAAHHGTRVIVHAGSGGYSLARRWSPENFAAVADTLHTKYNAQIVLVGTPDDKASAVRAAMQTPAIDLSGKTTLPQLADIIRSADLYIGADSGVLHLAAAVRTPMIGIFGPSNHRAYGPWSPGGTVVILRSGVECSPCSYVGHELGLREGCAARTCMKLVTPAMVLEAAENILNPDLTSQPAYQVSSPKKASTRASASDTNDESLDLTLPAVVAPYAPAGDEPPKIPAWHDRVRILGLPVDRITYPQWMDLIDTWVKNDTGAHHVCTTNPEFMMIAQRDFNFKVILQRADLCIADGVGLLWAARVLGKPLPERVTGSDGTGIIAQHAAQRGWKLFLLGAAPGIAERAAEIMRGYLPGLQIVGTYAGSPKPEDEADLVARVNASGADILLVAYGAPQQDKWIARNLPRLQVKMAMGIGGALDFIAGIVPRAPEWMRRYGLEWLYRLMKQPWRIIRMTRLPRFVIAVLLRGER